jgi:hypothetical protein
MRNRRTGETGKRGAGSTDSITQETQKTRTYGRSLVCARARDLYIHGNGGQRRSPFTSSPVLPWGIRRLLARWRWLRHYLHPPAWAVLDVWVIRSCVLAVVPVDLGRRRGRRLDHHGRRGIVGVVGVGCTPPAGSPPPWPPPPEASANEDPRAPVPPAAAVVPMAAPPGATAMEPGAPPRGYAVPPAAPMPPGGDPPGASAVGPDAASNGSPGRPAAALKPSAAPARRLGGEDRPCHQQPCRHDRQDHLLHGQSPCAVPKRCIGLLPIPSALSRAASPAYRRSALSGCRAASLGRCILVYI